MIKHVETIDVADEAVCYRHGDRPTGVRCQRCLRYICGECMVAASVGFQCRACATAGIAGAGRSVHRFRATPYVTYGLIAANIVVALFGLATSNWMQGDLGTIGLRGGLLGGGIEIDQGQVHLIGVNAGEWYRIVTGAFIHSGPLHLGFNMLALWQVGMLLETAFGRLRFALLYGVAVLGGAFGALLLTPDGITVGASGGVFGLMGALFVAERGGLFGGQRTAVGMFIVINLVFTFAVPGISIGGHVGGLAAGAATGWAFQEFERRKLSPALPIAATLALSVTLFAACLWAASHWLDPIL